MTNFGWVSKYASERPDGVAFIDIENSVSWREFAEQRNGLAHSLIESGIKPGDRAVVYLRNSVEFFVACAAADSIGAIAVPMNWRLAPEEVSQILEHSSPTVVFVDDTFLDLIEPIRDVVASVRLWVSTSERERPWAQTWTHLAKPCTTAPAPTLGGGSMAYTGGSSGRPKAVLRQRSGDRAIAKNFLEEMHLAEEHIHLLAGALYHAGPFGYSTNTLRLGGTVVIMRKFGAEDALSLIERHRCTSSFMPPALAKRLVALSAETRRKYDTSSLRVLVVTGAPCPMSVKEEILSAFGPIYYESYGATELVATTVLRPEDVLRKPGSCGRVIEGLEVGILDDNGRLLPQGTPGEIAIRNYPGLFPGYYNDMEATEEAIHGEWVSVGDVGYLDADAFLYICDRKKDMIISGGANIYCNEVEDVLHRHPDIADVVVFGVPDEEWGESVHAAVEVRDGKALSAIEVSTFAREHLAGYKVPREVSFHDPLPRDEAGKLAKRALRDQHWISAGRRI